MLNIYLFIELLGAANLDATLATLNKLDLGPCKFANVVALSDEKLVAQLDCGAEADANNAILQKIIRVDGVVQANIIAVVRPKK